MNIWIDSHCHLDRYAKKGELSPTLEAAETAGVQKMIAVGTDSEDWRLYEKLAKEHTGQIYYSVGLHPCHVQENWDDELIQIMPYFSGDVEPVALGEIGLDRFHLPKDPAEAEIVMKRQKMALRKQLSFALQLDVPVIVHSRGAFEEVVEEIDQSGVNWKKVVFHCFSEGVDEVRLLNERGGRASYTGIITYKNAENVRKGLIEQGIERLMIETDAPYLAPVPHRGKENFPAYVVEIGKKAAELLGIEEAEAAERIWENTVSFFGL